MSEIIKEVVTRTGGEMYLGVVGPVRSGKSTFIRRFMEIKVLPFINDENTYHKVLDELPQSGEGKTIMTVEPKFVPTNNMTITIEDNLNVNIRLVDCVGYIIESAKGYQNDDGSSRLVQTPWFQEAIPFGDAAGVGTKKVIESHSNIGVLITSDGSFGEFSREEYEKIEESMVEELKGLDKPFVIILNTVNPNSEETKALSELLKEKYQVSVIALDVNKMSNEDIDNILKEALSEFNISELNLEIPTWINELDDDIPFKNEFKTFIGDVTANYRKMKDVFLIQEKLNNCEFLNKVEILNIDSGTGIVDFDLTVDESIYKQIIEEIIGEPINDKAAFIKTLQNYKKAKNIYAKVGDLERVHQIGYDIIVPPLSEITLHEPEITKQGGRYGIKIKATANALLINNVTIDSSFEPIIGNEAQSQLLVDHMIEDYNNNPELLWNSEIFGRKLGDVISDSIKIKVNQVPDVVMTKYNEGITKVVNQSKGGVLAIIL